MNEPSLWSFIAGASPVVKLVMTLLLCASIASWTMIFERWSFIKRARQASRAFEKRFWSGVDLNDLYASLEEKGDELSGMKSIFFSGFREFLRLSQKSSANADAIMQGSERAMRVAQAREMEQSEKHLSFLATVGSTSPYIGLFGTVWGIMASFRALGVVQQATISMVAPGISEALIATAMGLFAAIPAVIAYNRFASDVSRLTNQYDTFQEELTSILHRQAHGS